jgi:hypothetical protein
MIKLIKEGRYRLFETKNQTKVLVLDKKNTYAWINAAEIGEILVSSEKEHSVDCILSVGNFRMYEVNDEPKLVDTIHLELCVGSGAWQGYLLPLGLPTAKEKKHRIIPTTELISRTARSHISYEEILT